MNGYLLVAGGLVILLALIHSILGEWMMFRRAADNTLFNDQGSKMLTIQHLRTLRACWHLISVLAWGVGVILLQWASETMLTKPMSFALAVLSITFLITALYWAWGTRGKHPAWSVLLIISVLLYLAR